MHSRIGQQFGNFRLLRLLGQGGFAEVYLGQHIHVGNLRAAIKILNTSSADVQKFREEAGILATLQHPNIVRVRDFNVENGLPFLIMDYAPGGTLRSRYPQGTRLHFSELLSYVAQAASALQYAHNHRVFHRDVKPENMLFGERNELLLSDFGIAVMTATSSIHYSKSQSGTAMYMAPEQIDGRVHPASDQYALGIVTYEWLCGEVPFRGSFREITGQHLHKDPPSFSEKGLRIDPAVEAVVMKALAKEPGQRFPSIQEFALALQQSYPGQHTNPLRGNATTNPPSIAFPSSDRFSHMTHMPESLPGPLPVSKAETVPPQQDSWQTTRPETTQSRQSTTRRRSPETQPASPGLIPPTVPNPYAHPLPIKRRSNSGGVLTSIICIVVLLALLYAGGAYLVPKVSGFFSSVLSSPHLPPTGQTSTPEQLIDDFCENLKGKNYQAAYTDYSKRFQNEVVFNDFVKYWSANSAAPYQIDRCDHQTISTPAVSNFTVSWSTHEFFSSQMHYYNVTFVKENDQWKIDNVVQV